jgi:hypothetical protein
MACLAMPVLADAPALRTSARLLFKNPELLRPGSCVMYKEGGSGWVLTEPQFYLRGTILSSEVRTRQLASCPVVPNKNVAQYSREEFNRLSLAYPCLEQGVSAQEMQIGLVRLRVNEWETPHAKLAANSGRLYRGMFIDKPLKKNMEIEMEADLLEACAE